jgi:Cft2 family RNA processing exonuclease
MKLTDLNTKGGIGANSLLVEIGKFTLLIDSGLNPKATGLEGVPNFSQIRDRQIDFAILTHCHLDHLGSFPVFLREHPETDVLMSQPSHSLAERMLHNSVNVMKRQREEQHIPEYPLFTHAEVERLRTRFLPLIFGQKKKIRTEDDELELTLFSSGHIPGAAGIEITHKHRSIFFTGDVLFDNQLIIPGAKFPRRDYDTVVMETTHGATPKPKERTRDSEVESLVLTINKTIRRNGSVLIPVFALGRMQEILTILQKAVKAGKIPKCPVFGAGLGMDIANYFDQIARKTGLVKFNRGVIKDLKLQNFPRNLQPGRDASTPGIYVLGSGMLIERTPSYNMAASLLAHHHNSICFVGYCDPDTPGGKLLDTKTGETFLFESLDYQTPVRAEIEKFDMSGHAIREDLLEFAIQANPRAVVLTHGDQPARDWFVDSFLMEAPNIKVTDPTPLQTFQI